MTQPSPIPSLWDQKPWWCQPWSIVLTGVMIPSVAWMLTHRLLILVPLVIGVGGWWTLFLYLVPQAYKRELGGSPNPGDYPLEKIPDAGGQVRLSQPPKF